MPRVEWIRYSTNVPIGSVSYECEAFSLEGEDRRVTFRPKIDFRSVEEADREIGQFLRSFEADVVFRSSEPVELRFEQGQESSGRGVARLMDIQISVPDAAVARQGQKPWEFTPMATAPETRELVEAYESWRVGRYRLTTVSYLVLSHMQRVSEGRSAAARRYNIDRSLLDKIGRLSSEVGGIEEGRKLDARSEDRPLRDDEKYWLECATRMLIARIYDIDVRGRDTATITEDSLPSLQAG